MSKSKFYGVELDSVSGRIGKLLYPESEVQVKGLEETGFSNNFFDVARCCNRKSSLWRVQGK